EQGSYDLLILSQVILSMQLPFAVIPLIQYTSDKGKMGEFANKAWVRILAWAAAIIIIGLNAKLVIETITVLIQESNDALWPWLTVVPVAVGCALLLVYIALPKFFRRRKEPVPLPATSFELVDQRYARIGVALDYGGMDVKVLSHAVSAAKRNEASLYLFHVVEGVSGQLFGGEAYDDEARKDKEHLETIAAQLREKAIEVHAMLGYGSVPKQLVKLSTENNIDLLIMGAHGHRGVKDLIFGASISEVRHALSIPVLVVK
ncbi:MAG: universal stress protein, partial [Bacteroidota bacterium]